MSGERGGYVPPEAVQSDDRLKRFGKKALRVGVAATALSMGATAIDMGAFDGQIGDAMTKELPTVVLKPYGKLLRGAVDRDAKTKAFLKEHGLVMPEVIDSIRTKADAASMRRAGIIDQTVADRAAHKGEK